MHSYSTISVPNSYPHYPKVCRLAHAKRISPDALGASKTIVIPQKRIETHK